LSSGIAAAKRSLAAATRGALLRILPSCRSYYAERDVAPRWAGPHQYSDELDRRDSQKGENKKVAVFERIVIAENV